MKILLKSLACFLALIPALPAWAGSISEYSADMVDVKSGRVVQKIAVAPDKIYSESLSAQGRREALAIIRLDQKKMYVFIEATKSYMELPFNKERFTAADLNMGMVQTKQEKMGTEKVGDYMADKFMITASVMGISTTAYQWLAPEFDPLPVRIESDGGVQEMQNIKTGSPDPALFEIPAGYKRDAQMEQMMKGMLGQ
jgi:hypothetical protein